ncbi:hypothetical protein [Kribbella sp. NPDC004875]|uniref:hypothetical protein n=1 Tax=Kribbella sp. NPDC004875 TaxID=3364107 RepID=UPI003676C027
MRSTLRDRLEIGALVVATLGLLPLFVAFFVLRGLLAEVDPSQVSAGITRYGDPLGTTAALALLCAVVVVGLFAGLPVRGPLWSSRGTTRGAVAQGIGGVVIAVEALVADLGYFYFMGPDDGCTYPSCWPLHQQTAAMAAPGILTGLSMVVMALLAKRSPWWARALVPLVVLLGGLALQHAVWNSYLLPIFQGAPR